MFLSAGAETPDDQAPGITGVTGDYLGQTPSGLDPVLFAEGLISTALQDSAPHFLPDGRAQLSPLPAVGGRSTDRPGTAAVRRP